MGRIRGRGPWRRGHMHIRSADVCLSAEAPSSRCPSPSLALLILQPLLLFLELAPVRACHENLLALKQMVLLHTVLHTERVGRWEGGRGREEERQTRTHMVKTTSSTEGEGVCACRCMCMGQYCVVPAFTGTGRCFARPVMNAARCCTSAFTPEQPG